MPRQTNHERVSPDLVHLRILPAVVLPFWCYEDKERTVGILQSGPPTWLPAGLNHPLTCGASLPELVLVHSNGATYCALG